MPLFLVRAKPPASSSVPYLEAAELGTTVELKFNGGWWPVTLLAKPKPAGGGARDTRPGKPEYKVR